MSNRTLPFFWQRFTYPDGRPLSGGQIFFYVAGSTSIPKRVYSDGENSNPITQPLILDAGGLAPQYFVEDGLYSIVIKDANGAEISTRDYVIAGGGGTPADPADPSALAVWTILKASDPAEPDFGLSGDDLNNIFQHGYGVAASFAQTTDPESALSIWYLRGATWEARQWVEEPQGVGQAILNLNHGNFDFLHTHPEYREGDRTEALSNYPAGLYTLGRDSADGHEWVSLVIKEFPEPSYAVTSLLKYDATGKAFVWLPYDELTAMPVGPAGGDLFGTYPDPRVKELTGVPSMLVIKDVAFNWLNPNVPPYSHYLWAAGAGIGFGSGYVGSTKRKCWMACSQLGELWVSYDDFKTTVNESYIALPSFDVLRYAGIYYIKLPGTEDYYWIFTANNGRLSLKDIPENFNPDGTPIIDNMWAITFINAADINAMAYSDSTLVFVGNGTSIRYAEAADITVAGEALTITLHIAVAASGFGGAVPTAVTGGIGFNGTRFIVDERDTGWLFTSEDGKVWSHLPIGSCVYQDGTEVVGTVVSDGVSFGNLSVVANRWSSILFANDVWIICNPRLYTGEAPDWIDYDAWTPYVFSYDGVNWNAYQPTKEELAGSDAFKASFYKAAYGNGLILATNQNPAQAEDGQPALYQMLIDQIAAHRRLVCERGLTVAGTTYLVDLPNAKALGTGPNGEIIEVDGGGSGNPFDYLQLRESPLEPIPDAPGVMRWNATDGTVDLALLGSTTLQVGQEVLIRVLNNTGAMIPNGAVVYISGAQGNRITVALAEADVVGASTAIAVSTQIIPNNQEGYVTRVGLVRNIDTSAFPEGSTVFLSNTPGVLSSSPSASAYIRIGYIARSHVAEGSLFVAIESVPTPVQIASASQCATMQVGGANEIIIPTFNGVTELLTLFSPYVTQKIFTASTFFKTYLLQANAGNVQFVIRSTAGKLIAHSGVITNPAGASYLTSQITAIKDPATQAALQSYVLDSRMEYYMGIRYNMQMNLRGKSGGGPANIQPWIGWQVENQASSSVPAAQISGGGSVYMYPFIEAAG